MKITFIKPVNRKQTHQMSGGVLRFSSRGLVLAGVVTAAIAFSGLSHAAQPVAAPKGQLQLAVNGNSRYVIALARDAIPAENTAAQELQNYLQQVTGAKLAIRSEGAVPEAAPQI